MENTNKNRRSATAEAQKNRYAKPNTPKRRKTYADHNGEDRTLKMLASMYAREARIQERLRRANHLLGDINLSPR